MSDAPMRDGVPRTSPGAREIGFAVPERYNASAILSDYRKQGEALWDRFNPEAGKDGTVGYYSGLVSAYSAPGHHAELIADLDFVVSQLEVSTGHQGRWPPSRPGS